MKQTLNMLFLAYLYPPSGGSASLRAEKLARYLPLFGVNPTVLSARGARYPIREEQIPPLPTFYTPAREFPPPPRWLKSLSGKKSNTRPVAEQTLLTIEENRLEKLLEFFLIPDKRLGWLPGCVRKGVELVREQKLDAVLSTAPPFTSHLAAALIARLSGVPLLLDYRDAWSLNPFKRPPTALHGAINRSLERWCGSDAAAIVGVTAPMVEQMQELTGSGPLFRHIPNGYDEDDFAGLPLPSLEPPLTIVYAGTFYGTRQPTTLFAALAELVAAGKITQNDLRIVLIGNHPPAVRALAPPGIAPLLDWRGVQSHAQAVATMAAAHVNWLVIGSDPGAESTATGKLYEYLRAPGRILAHVPDGVATSIVAEHDAGTVIEPGNIEATKTEILNLLSAYRRPDFLRHRRGDITIYERHRIAGQMAELIRTVCN